MRPSVSALPIAFALALSSALLPCRGLAATHRWTGLGIGNNWNDNANWDFGGAPNSNGTDDILYRPDLAFSVLSTVNVNHNINSVSFIDTDLLNAPNFTINGTGRMQFQNASAGIFNQSVTAQTILAPILLNTSSVRITNSFSGLSNRGLISLNSAINTNGNTLEIFAGENGIRSDGSITGAGGLLVRGTGALTLRGANSYSGGTSIGGGDAGGRLVTGADNVIPAGDFSISKNGVLDLSGQTEGIGPGAVDEIGLNLFDNAEIIAGDLFRISTLGTFISYSSGSDTSSGASIHSGTLSLGTSTATRQISVGDNPNAEDDLTISATIINAANNPDSSTPVLEKSASGRLTLSGNNTFWRGAKVSRGTLRIQSNGGLGNGDGTANTGTVVSGGNVAVLELDGDLNIPNEHLTLGDDFGLGGATLSVLGDVTWGGPVALEGINNAISVGDNHTLTLDGPISDAFNLLKQGLGTLLLEADSSFSGDLELQAGAVGGSGSIDGEIILSSGTTIAPGASTGILTVDAVDFAADSTFAVELAGDGGVAGTDFDQLVVSGVADLTGAILDVQLLDEFEPGLGDSFEILTAGTLSGTFSGGMSLPELTGQLEWDIDYDTDSDRVVLGVVDALGPDFDLDGDVDVADALAWQREGGSAASLAAWRAAFGTGGEAPPDISAVPEPTALMIASVGVCLAWQRRRRFCG